MGFFSKLAFWKKKDDFGDLGKDLGMDLNQGPSPDLGMGLEPNQQFPQQQPYQKYPSFQPSQNFQAPAFQQSPYPQPSQSSDNYIASKNLEVISSKLDALRASLESISQRLANIEAIARGEQEDTRSRRRYY